MAFTERGKSIQLNVECLQHLMKEEIGCRLTNGQLVKILITERGRKLKTKVRDK